MPQIAASFTDNSRCVIYNCNVFMVQANGVYVAMLHANKLECFVLGETFQPCNIFVVKAEI